MRARLLALALLVPWLLPRVVTGAEPTGADGTVAVTTLDASFDVDRRRLSGTVTLTLANPTAAPLASAYLWLLPNRFRTPPPGLADSDFDRLYPEAFDAGWMRIATHAGVVTPRDHARAGRGVLVEITLATPVAPGALLTLPLAFETRVPERTGGFGCVGDDCTLLGGFHPMLAALDAAGWALGRAPQPSRFRGRLALTRARDVVIAGTLHADARAVDFHTGLLSHLPLVIARARHESRALAHGVNLVYLGARRPPPSRDADAQLLPYTEEDLAARALDAAGAAVGLLASTDAAVPLGASVVIVEAALRDDLALAHPGMIVVSDRLHRIFPAERFRRYHERELVRAIYTELLARRLPALEAEAGAGFLVDRFTLARWRRLEQARELLSPVSFVPAVDQLIYAPDVAFAGTYFGVIAESDQRRDDPRRFAHAHPGGQLLYEKLVDLLPPAALARTFADVVAGRASLAAAAVSAHGAPLDRFFAQWGGPSPRVNYRVGAVRRDREADRFRHTITLHRDGVAGDAPPDQPVEVAVHDGGGQVHRLRWNADSAVGTVSLLTRSPRLASVALDPRRRLAQSAAPGAPDDARLDDRTPPAWKFVYNNFGVLVDVSRLEFAFAADFALRRIHDNRRGFRLQLFHSEANTAGAAVYYTGGFGPKVTAARPLAAWSTGIAALRLDPEFTGRAGTRLSFSAGLGADDRRVLFEPRRARSLGAGVRLSATRHDDDGSVDATATLHAEATTLFTPAAGHTFVGAIGAATVIGEISGPGQLVGAGGPGLLSGYAPAELLGRARVTAHGEWRGLVTRSLDLNLGHFVHLRGAQVAALLDVGLVSSCGGWSDLPSSDALYASAGLALRFFYDNLGVQPGMTGIEIAAPLVHRARGCFGEPQSLTARPPLFVYLTFLPAF